MLEMRGERRVEGRGREKAGITTGCSHHWLGTSSSSSNTVRDAYDTLSSTAHRRRDGRAAPAAEAESSSGSEGGGPWRPRSGEAAALGEAPEAGCTGDGRPSLPSPLRRARRCVEGEAFAAFTAALRCSLCSLCLCFST